MSEVTEQEFPEEPVIGDGILTPPSVKEKKMAIELPESVAVLLMSETAGNIQANNASGRGIATAAMGALQAGIAKTHNELGPAESRAVSGVLATPVAGPTTAQSAG